MHESMDPKKALLRESRDSDTFPESIPIIAGMDVTGSMGYIPSHMIKEGIPTLISFLHEKGVNGAAVMFMGLGDSKCGDKAPFQVGQFESDDEPMDLWLTRTYIEGGGGGNGGESYSWAWWFADQRCVSDAWEKRGQKGFIFTVGDDGCHGITSTEFHEVLGINHKDVSAKDLYKKASEKWNVYHFHLKGYPNEMASYMGENFINMSDYTKIPEMMAKIISSHAKISTPTAETEANPSSIAGTKVTL